MGKPVWRYLCPSCGRPFLVRSEQEHPLPAEALNEDCEMHELNAWQGSCSACTLRIMWEPVTLALTFSTQPDFKTPKPVDLADG